MRKRVTAYQKNDGTNTIRFVVILTVCIAGATGLGWLFRYLNFPETNIVVVYILSVLITARFTRGYGYGIAASALATGAFNYFFTDPYFTMSVNDPTYLITFAIMMLTAIITGALTSKVKQNVIKAQEQETEANALYRLTNHLTDAQDIADISSITIRTISDIMNCQAAILCFDESGNPERSFIQQRNSEEQVHRNVEESAEIRHRIEQLRTAFDMGMEFYDWPIYGRNAILGILRIPKETAAKMSGAQARMLRSMIESTALAMDRFRSAQEHIKSRDAITQERYRSNLLRAISHDLRTPLSGIMGTSEMLMGSIEKSDSRYLLAEDIFKEADWLHGLVENILSLTRLQEGKLILNKQTEAAEEVIGVAVAAIGKRAPEYEISVKIPDEVMLIPMEAKLIEQVLVNLMDNAVKNTPKGKEISISVKEDLKKRVAVFCVSDRGRGFSSEDLPHIFQMFYTTHDKGPDAQRGVGLGLAICESIITAHGGTIEAHNRKDGIGAEVIFALPMEDESYAE